MFQICISMRCKEAANNNNFIVVGLNKWYELADVYH